ncbi:formylglycine-generating enzyme family protein [Sorangium sp. So ce388]|uniref:formylglycine-generating enzyme family protein n=1 Tax=Sorangium sp. So ce388 TaxID=3133309 RepID=UPI003F5C06FD
MRDAAGDGGRRGAAGNPGAGETRLRLRGILLPAWSARGLSVLLMGSAVGLPWVARWLGVLRHEGAPGQTGEVVDVALRPELVELPGGTFLMDSPEGELGRRRGEAQHPATVAPFAICRTEVTLGQWEAVMGTRPNDCDFGCEDEHPVQGVTGEDAIRYLNRLTDRENRTRPAGEQWTHCYDEATWTWERGCTGYRLPTEAEWEYAARAGTTTAYSFGEDAKDACKYGNCMDLSLKKRKMWTVNDACDDGFADLAPVARFQPNAWGLHDVHGNVWEWVWSSYSNYAKQTEVGYVGLKTDSRWVLRGGSFREEPRTLRASDAISYPDSPENGTQGFRCARGAPPSP